MSSNIISFPFAPNHCPDEDGSVNESVGPTVSERDNSLEMSFRWPDGPSLPPAQPRREDSLELFNGEAGKRKVCVCACLCVCGSLTAHSITE